MKTYTLLSSSTKKIDETRLTKVLEAARATPDQVMVKSLVAALADVNIDDLLKQSAAATAAPSTPAKGKIRKRRH